MERDNEDLDVESGEVLYLKRKDILDPDSNLFSPSDRYLRGALFHMANHHPIRGFALISGDDGGYLRVLHEPSEVPAEERKKYDAACGIAQLSMMMASSQLEWEDLKGRPIEEVEKTITQEVSQNPEVTLYVFYRFID